MDITNRTETQCNAIERVSDRFQLNRECAVDETIKREIAEGLLAAQPFVSPKYFYDTVGSHLFEMITSMPEYYLTRTEMAILDRYSDEIAAAVGTGTTFIDLGAGNCEKARSLLCYLKPAQYVAVDISIDFLRSALSDLQRAFPKIKMAAINTDVCSAFSLPNSVRQHERLFFYPGSSIGNFTPEEARLFLTRIKEQCGKDGGLLIGVDLIKPETVLNPAYDDAAGITAAFNLNLLHNLNRLIGSDFSVADWRHRAFFNVAFSRIEMYLEAKRAVCVTWPGGRRLFAKAESIHTENSYKYAVGDFRNLLSQAGFRHQRTWLDENRWFAVCHVTV